MSTLEADHEFPDSNVPIGSAQISGSEVPSLDSSAFPSIRVVSPSTRIEGDVALVAMLGGTSARAVLATADMNVPAHVKVSWEEFRKLPENSGRDIAKMPDEFVRYFAARTLQLMDGRLHPQQIKRVAVSVAGWTNGSQQSPRISTTNTGVEFKDYPFIEGYVNEMFGAASDITAARQCGLLLEGWDQVNDGWAATYGEYIHPRGKLYGRDRGIGIVIGTGAGGAAMMMGQRVPDVTELGHIFWYNKETREYEYRDLNNFLIPKGYYENGQWVDQDMNGYVYFEHRNAGPWNAVLYAKKIVNTGDEADDEALTRALCNRLRQEDPHFTFTPEEFKRYVQEELKQKQRAHWASMINDSFILPINKFINSMSLALYSTVENRHDGHRDPDAELIKFTWEFKMRRMRELGRAMAAVRRQFPSFPIVFVGSMVENLAKDVNFMPIVLENAGCAGQPDQIQVSCLSDVEREAAFAACKLRGASN